jgi:hypothetical protein
MPTDSNERLGGGQIAHGSTNRTSIGPLRFTWNMTLEVASEEGSLSTPQGNSAMIQEHPRFRFAIAGVSTNHANIDNRSARREPG